MPRAFASPAAGIEHQTGAAGHRDFCEQAFKRPKCGDRGWVQWCLPIAREMGVEHEAETWMDLKLAAHNSP